MENKKWKIFVMFHHQLFAGNYTSDETFSHDNFCYINCNENIEISYDKSFGYDIINEYELPNYDAWYQKKHI